MDSPFFVIGNWKSNKTVTEATDWFKEFSTLWTSSPYSTANIKVILCVPFIHLTAAATHIKTANLPLVLGVQTISAYPSGAYTGEISAAMVKDLATYTLIGHSERRNYFQEKITQLSEKCKRAQEALIIPIVCVPSADDPVPEGVEVIAYEPVWAIGTGKTESPENANGVAEAIKKRINRSVRIIYGGSVTADNVGTFVLTHDISGVLPGGASLNPQTFYSLILNASKAKTEI